MNETTNTKHKRYDEIRFRDIHLDLNEGYVTL
jgi:hypothetical protein